MSICQHFVYVKMSMYQHFVVYKMSVNQHFVVFLSSSPDLSVPLEAHVLEV